MKAQSLYTLLHESVPLMDDLLKDFPDLEDIKAHRDKVNDTLEKIERDHPGIPMMMKEQAI